MGLLPLALFLLLFVCGQGVLLLALLLLLLLRGRGVAAVGVAPVTTADPRHIFCLSLFNSFQFYNLAL